MVWPPLIARGEESADPWQRLFERARQVGLTLEEIRGVTSDGAQGVLSFLRRRLPWVQHQRCVWHFQRNLAGMAEAAAQAAAAVASELAEQVRNQVGCFDESRRLR